jgi:hypothetical protein
MIVGKPKLDQDGTFTMEKGWKMGMKSHEKWIKMVEHEDLSWISW